MSSQKRNKIPAVYLNDETHQAMKKWAEYQGITMPQLAQNLLQEMEPVLTDMIKAYEDILAGKNSQVVLQNMLAKGLSLASEKLHIEEIEDDTDDGSGS